MKYNKSEIMKNAWKYNKSGKAINFNTALKLSWRDAKTVPASDVKVGDSIEIEYGRDENFAKCVVTNIEEELFMNKFLVIKAVCNGLEIEFCAKPTDRIIRTATASKLAAVA